MDAILPHVSRDGADPNTLAYGSPTKDNEVDSEGPTDDERTLPIVRRRGDETESLPSYAFGMVFLRPIRVGPSNPVPRLSNDGSALHPKAFAFFFPSSLEDMRADFVTGRIHQRSNRTRIANKTKRTPIHVDSAAAEDNHHVPTFGFNLAAEGYTLRPIPVDTSPDAEQLDEDVPNDHNDYVDIDDALTHVWRQFPLDIVARASNSKAADRPSHISLDQDARLHVTADTYTNRNLAAYFRDCQWKISSKKEWQAIFDRLWPRKGAVFAGTKQNYIQSRYFVDWMHLHERADEATIERMRVELKKEFDKFYFIPWAASDRIWNSRYSVKFQKSSGLPRREPCPLIAIRPGQGPPEWVDL
jgi:hypothetical protein